MRGLIKKVSKTINQTQLDTKQKFWELNNSDTPKIFGIGSNKTGTTSLENAIREFGYKVGHQPTAEALHKEWAQRDFSKIVAYCKSAEFFQDIPFSKPFTYIALDQAFPGSKFILTIRDSPEQWYNSLIKFQTKLWGKNGNIPTKEDLMNASYLYKGWVLESRKMFLPVTDENLFDKEILIKSYIDHNDQVVEYFRHRANDLLVLNVAQPNAYLELCKFLGKEAKRNDFPWYNKTSEL